MKIKELALIVTLVVLLVPLTALLEPDRSLPAAALPQQEPQQEKEDEAAPATVGEEGVYTGAPEFFRVLNRSTGRVEEMAAADFVRGAVAAEMPPLYHSRALKAQAVAAYSYAVCQALKQRNDPSPELKGADFEIDPPNMQVCLTEQEARAFYGEEFDLYWNKVCEAADRVGRYILLYEGKPVAAAYHAISAGKTEDAAYVWQGEALPYLQAVESEGDLLAAGYETTVDFTARELRQLLTEKLGETELPEDQSRWIVPLEWSPSGYVTRVQVGEKNLTGLELRFLLGLRSSHFQVEQGDGVFSFRVQGYGHGAGLSQNGADYMARQGATFDEILQHYYPGTTLALAALE